MSEKILVLAPHPDDELLGVGGTMARAAVEGAEVYVAVLTRGRPPLFAEEFTEQVIAEVRQAHTLLGVTETIFLTFPSCEVDTVGHGEVNAELVSVFQRIQPDAIYIPFNGDIHLDHQLFSLSAMVAARPSQPHAPRTIYAYETLSETNWNAPYITPGFIPNVFVDISEYLETKLQAMGMIASQVKQFPHERSLEALRALAMLRGATVNRHAAEAFVLIRDVQ